MKDYKNGSHTVWDCKYHLVWTTKYRYSVLVGDVGLRARELIREIARSLDLTIYAGAINREHVHLLIGIPPHVSVARALQYLKGRSSHKLLSEYAALMSRASAGWSTITGLSRIFEATGFSRGSSLSA